MGKSAMCIQMLQILNSGRVYKASELADLLETNPRNIIEYKKELEEAGYYIISIPGKFGGYQLDKTYHRWPLRCFYSFIITSLSPTPIKSDSNSFNSLILGAANLISSSSVISVRVCNI